MGVVRLLGAFWSPLPCTLTRNDSFFLLNKKKNKNQFPFFSLFSLSFFRSLIHTLLFFFCFSFFHSWF